MEKIEIEIKIYELVDAFLVEAKDQNGNDRSLDRLNMDRQLFVERMSELLATERRKAVEGFADVVEDRFMSADEEGMKRLVEAYLKKQEDKQ